MSPKFNFRYTSSPRIIGQLSCFALVFIKCFIDKKCSVFANFDSFPFSKFLIVFWLWKMFYLFFWKIKSIMVCNDPANFLDCGMLMFSAIYIFRACDYSSTLYRWRQITNKNSRHLFCVKTIRFILTVRLFLYYDNNCLTKYFPFLIYYRVICI